MKKSDELLKLEEQYRTLTSNGSLSGSSLEFVHALFELLNKNEVRLNDLEDRIVKLEDFSDILSMDLYDIQTAILKKLEEHSETDPIDHGSANHVCHCGDHDHDHCDCGCDCDDDCDCEDHEPETSFFRCPYCNTIIFSPLGDSEDEEFVCPFCGEKFLQSDILS